MSSAVNRLLHQEFEEESKPLPSFGCAEFWDREYEEAAEDDGRIGQKSFDWLTDWEDLGWLLCSHILGLGETDLRKRILHLGSGTSNVPEKLYSLGYTNGQVVTDVSSTSATFMRDRYAAAGIPPAALRSVAADAVDLRRNVLPSDSTGRELDDAIFSDNRYNVVIEKATLDALECHDDQHAQMILGMLKEVHRVLRKGRDEATGAGTYFCQSMHEPRFIARYLNLRCFGWHVVCLPLVDVSQRKTDGEGVSASIAGESGDAEADLSILSAEARDAELQRLRRQYNVRAEQLKQLGARQTSSADDLRTAARQRRVHLHYCYICTLSEASEDAMARHWDEIYAAVAAAPDEYPPRHFLVDETIPILPQLS